MALTSGLGTINTEVPTLSSNIQQKVIYETAKQLHQIDTPATKQIGKKMPLRSWLNGASTKS